MTHFVRFKRSSESFSFETAAPSIVGNSFLPSVALVPLRQQRGAESKIIIQTGERVREGQLLARSPSPEGCNVHAPIPGVLRRVREVSLPDGTMGQAAEIVLSGSFDILGRREDRCLWNKIPSMELCKILEDKGVVNTSGDPEPLSACVRAAKRDKYPAIILRLFDSDPTTRLDSLLAREELSSVIEGCAILASAIGAREVVAVHERKRPVSIDASKLDDLFPGIDFRLAEASGRYPDGNRESLLTYAYGSRSRPEAPSILCIDPGTALAARDAIVKNQPTLSRYVYVSGSALAGNALLRVRIGTPIGDLIEECGGFIVPPSRVIVNGLITGHALYDLDTPVTKSTKSLHVMGSDECPDYDVQPCIHCGSCLMVCPVKIDPARTVTLIRKDRVSPDVSRDIAACQACGCCAMVCPSRIPLHHVIRSAKNRDSKGGSL